MAIRFIIGTKDGKSWKLESDAEALMGKSIGDKFEGKDIKVELEGYSFEIIGGSDSSGFPLSKNVEGLALKRVLLTRGFGMRDNREGVRMKKTLRGKVISATTAQLNLKIIKEGSKKLSDIFSDQNKPAEVVKPASALLAPVA